MFLAILHRFQSQSIIYRISFEPADGFSSNLQILKTQAYQNLMT